MPRRCVYEREEQAEEVCVGEGGAGREGEVGWGEYTEEVE